MFAFNLDTVKLVPGDGRGIQVQSTGSCFLSLALQLFFSSDAEKDVEIFRVGFFDQSPGIEICTKYEDVEFGRKSCTKRKITTVTLCVVEYCAVVHEKCSTKSDASLI